MSENKKFQIVVMGPIGWTDDFENSEYAQYDNEKDARLAVIELAEIWGMSRNQWSYVNIDENGEWNDFEVA